MLVSRTWSNCRRAIDSTILEQRIQKVLTSDAAQKRFLYHRKLVQLISELYRNIDQALVESVAIAHFLHFQYLYYSINYEFLPFNMDDETEAKRALHLLEDKSLEIASQLIPDQFDNQSNLHNLYRFLNENIGQYHKECSRRVTINRDAYESITAQVASVLHLPVDIFSMVSGDQQNNEQLKSGLNYYFLGKKIVMDIVDFKNDARVGTWNYVQSTFNHKMQTENISVENMDATKKARYFFVSGVAENLYLDAIALFKKNSECWENLSSKSLKMFPQLEIRYIQNMMNSLDRLIEKAAGKVGVTLL